MAEPLAHSGGHLLKDHLQAVAALAGQFSNAFDAAPLAHRWAYLAGFQRYLSQSYQPQVNPHAY